MSAPSSSSYQTAWNKALEHLDKLPPEQQKYFDLLEPDEKAIFRKSVDPGEVLEVLKRLEESKPSIRRITRFSENFAKPFAQFHGTIDAVATTCSGLGAPIWAPIKLILQALMSAAAEFEKIAGFLEDTLEKLTLFKKYEEHFRSSTGEAFKLVHDALTDFYVDVIDLTLVASKHYRCSIFKYLARRVVKTFDSDFGTIVLKMKRHIETTGSMAGLGGVIENRHYHQDASARLGHLKTSADKARFEERKLATSKWLFCTSAKSHLELNHDKHLDTTCNWFFQTPKFRAWRESKDSSRICVQGIPGCGKSVLSSVIISKLKIEIPREESIVYFFCKENDANRDNPLSILRTLIFQLLDHPTHKVTFIDMVYNALLSSGTPSADSMTDLWALLEKMVLMLPAIHFVIDALDECSNKNDELVNFLTRITTLSTSNATVLKVLATCRLNEPHINSQVDKIWSLFLIEEDNVQDDIDVFISKRIKESSTLSLDKHKDRVYSSIRKGAGGMILWAKLMLDELSNADSWSIEKILEDMPDKLSAVYKLILLRRISLGRASLEKCRRVLYLITIARRPLLLDEILVALAVSAGVKSHEEYDSGLDRIGALQQLQRACGSLITILEDGSVQLVHTSLRQYLLKGINTMDSQDQVSSAFAISVDQAHMDLARICLQYNQFTCFREDINTFILDDIKIKYPFLAYSTCNWIYHVSHSGSSRAELSAVIITFFNSTQGWRWLQRCQLFDITEGHLLLLQADLKEWARGENLTIQSDSNEIMDFILYLSQKGYEETVQGMGDDNAEAMNAAFRVADVYRSQGRYVEALELYERALAGCEKALGKEHTSTLDTVNNMAIVYQNQGRYVEALELYERALAGYEKALGKEHMSTLNTVNNMAIVYQNQGRYAKALELYERALAGKEKALGKEHTSTLNTVNNMAIVYQNQGRYAEALELYERALAGKEKALGKEHTSTLRTVNNMAAVYQNQGRYVEALELYERALAGREKALGKEHTSTLDTVSNIAIVYQSQGRYAEALELYERALAGSEKTLGKEHPSTLDTVSNIANVYENQGRHAEALELYERALAGREKALGKEHPSTLDTVSNIAIVYQSQGRYAEALELYERALAGKEKALGKEHTSTLPIARCTEELRAHLKT